MCNILVTGSKGQLGSEMNEIAHQYPNYHFIFTDVEELNITNHTEVAAFIELHRIDIIINCAAYTAVDKAEVEVDIAKEINQLAVKNFAEIAKDKGIKLIHISTDYVFDGCAKIPYIESALPNPQSVYGNTKLAGEQALLNTNPKNSIIIRTSWVYSSFGNNFVKTMLRLSKEKAALNVVADQFGSPTYAADLAKAILTLLPAIKNEEVTIYHYANTGVCSWYDFAKAIFEIKGIELQLNKIDTAQYPTPAKRPKYSVLATQKIINKYQLSIPHWKTSLAVCLQKL
jgi:dTDP-4-dehydrorhamnose reductase